MTEFKFSFIDAETINPNNVLKMQKPLKNYSRFMK